MDTYLIKYLRDNLDNELSKKYIDFFKIELDWHIYNSERHISKEYHRNREKGWKEKTVSLLQYSNAIFKKPSHSEKLNILSTINFSERNLLANAGFNPYSPVWQPMGRKNIFGDLKTINWHKKIQNLIQKKDFYEYLNENLYEELEDFQKYLIDKYREKDFRALLVSSDQYFYSKYFIDVFKKLDRPSLVFSHGLPAIYSTDVDNRSDYLMVWSEKIKQNYINSGFDEAKIKVIGNLKYKMIPNNKELRSNLSDVLIVPVSSILWHQHEYDNTVVVDKSMIVLYLYKVQKVLKKLGVKKARYRPHPSIDKQWVHAFLDQDFFICDNESLEDSLKHSSLVIGATSTVLLESLVNGVNYLVFEPKEENNINMAGLKLVPPFDGSDEKVMIACNEDELEKMLRFNALTDYSLVRDYIQDFDISILKELIK
ncbi:hypothetical protein D0809_14625 [Flavobacterium circumlabens]|uniref:CDP-glycerol--glycerophosphate glycerophosphotransferase n=1 Tax=Flavobacterium circumlabens TaxID=2133765 RepID=A0A4Y7UC92_9FLAO|nr:hypothetical protein EV142_105142 [Flavobacterium circumlabens]TEB43402.1 hypothetical protein D0809_14625 [Flavobacterium circumlabens]